jgi:transposase
MVMPNQPMYRSQVLDHLGLVAGRFDELGLGDVLDHATQQHPELRDLTVGEAVKAMVLNGLGCINHALSLVPRFFHNTPTSRRMSPRVAPEQLNADALGRTLETLYAYGVTELYSLIAVSAAKRRGLRPTSTHRDTTSFHVDGRSNSNEAPEEQGVHITKGYSRDHRPDRNQVVLALIVEHQAGLPVLLQPLSGNSSDAQALGQVICAHIEPLHTPYGATYLVADSALYREDHLATLAQTASKWITRVPATVSAAHAALAHANPQAMAPLTEGYRYQALTSTYGSVDQRWLLIASAARQPPAQRTGDKQRRKQRAQEVQTFQKLCGTPFACAADARQALVTCAQGVQATFLPTSTVCAQPRYSKRGRPGRDAQPDQVGYQIEGALASSMPARQALIDHHRCFILATNELDEAQLPPHEVLASYQGQGSAERGCRFLNAPQFFAASLYLKKPERIMALLMVMTGC